MARGRWKPSGNQVADEAFSVLIRGKKPSRVYTKPLLISELWNPEVYIDFLKLCLDHDETRDLRMFRRGLLMVIRGIGPESVAKDIGISRVSLYRMLSPGGNPRLKNLLKLFQRLDIWLWIVDGEFMGRKSQVIRPKDVKRVRALTDLE